jgi:hypothetical protein
LGGASQQQASQQGATVKRTHHRKITGVGERKKGKARPAFRPKAEKQNQYPVCKRGGVG